MARKLGNLTEGSDIFHINEIEPDDARCADKDIDVLSFLSNEKAGMAGASNGN